MRIVPLIIVFSSLFLDTVRAGDGDCTSIEECAFYIRESIDIRKVYTTTFRGSDLEAVVRIDLDKQFNVVSVSIVKSNGSEDFKHNLLRVIENSGPFSKLKGLPDDQQEAFSDLQLYFEELGTPE